MVCRGAEGDTSPLRFYSRFVQTGGWGEGDQCEFVRTSLRVFKRDIFFFN